MDYPHRQVMEVSTSYGKQAAKRGAIADRLSYDVLTVTTRRCG